MTERDPDPVAGSAEGTGPSVPSMLDLIRLSPRHVFPPGGVDLYRHIAILTSLSEGDELLDVACGVGTPLIYWVNEFGAHGSGLDLDPAAVDRAEARVREEGLSEKLQFQEGSPSDLPYRDQIFDVAVGEMGLTATDDPEAAIRELVRVTKQGGSVVLIQLVWKAPVDPRRRSVLSSHLGARPLMLVELKRILREAGVVDLHTEDWSDEETAFRRHITKPFPDFAELFSLPEKVGILRRAWNRWGWKGLKTAVLREREVHRLLTRERIIGLDLVLGTRDGSAKAAERSPGGRRRRGDGERAPLPGKAAGDGSRRDREEAPAEPQGTGPDQTAPDEAAPDEAGAEPGEPGRTAVDPGRKAKEAGHGEEDKDRGRARDDGGPKEKKAGPEEAAARESEKPDEHEDTVGLPLFGGDGEGAEE